MTVTRIYCLKPKGESIGGTNARGVWGMRNHVLSYYVNIWIAGDYADAVRACREFCASTPLCVTVTPTEYVYVGGSQSGVLVRLINYPRFPSERADLYAIALALAEHLRGQLFQESWCVEAPDRTEWSTTHGAPA